MLRKNRVTCAVLTACALAGAYPLAAVAQSQIPLRGLTVAAVSDSGTLASLVGVRPLADGHVLVNDMSRRRLILFDSTLARFTVVADSAAGAPHPYWSMGGTVLPFPGDSTVFVNQGSFALVMVGPTGHVGRVFASPSAQDMPRLMAGSAVGAPQGFDPTGRLVYSVSRRPGTSPQSQQADSGAVTYAVLHDSAAVVRADLVERRVDTVAYLALAVRKTVTTSLGHGRGSTVMSAVNPLPAADDWAVLPDGTVAVVRVADYHIDWFGPDGTRVTTPKMPFDWRRVTDDEKRRMLDSAHRAFEADSARRQAVQRPPLPPDNGGARTMVSGGAPLGRFVAIEPSEMPDYYPPIRPGAVHADRDGNLWLLPSTSLLAGKGLVYDIVNRKGQVFEHIQLPAGRHVVAFAPGGVVYLASEWAKGVPRLERARISH